MDDVSKSKLSYLISSVLECDVWKTLVMYFTTGSSSSSFLDFGRMLVLCSSMQHLRLS